MIHLDVESPVPLYHQIADQLREAIQRGRLAPGDKLVPLREAAQRWGVHHHTVRHAYAELARMKLIESLGPKGTRVARALPERKARENNRELRSFIHATVEEARKRFGVSSSDLARSIWDLAGSENSAPAEVYVAECSLAQAQDLAEQLMKVWKVNARALDLKSIVELPEAPVVSTYFHYNEIRSRWPRRLFATDFVAIMPDPAIRRDLARFSRGKRGKARIDLLEYDEPTCSAVAADLSAVLDADAFEIQMRIVRLGKELLQPKSSRPRLYPPRIWSRLTDGQKNLPNMFEVRYVFDADELKELGERRGWPAAGSIKGGG